MRSPPTPGARCAGAGDPGPALERISCDRGRGGASLAMPRMRGPGGKDRAIALQGAVQQAIRRDRGRSLRECGCQSGGAAFPDRKSTRLNSSHLVISYAVFCLKKKKKKSKLLLQRFLDSAKLASLHRLDRVRSVARRIGPIARFVFFPVVR